MFGKRDESAQESKAWDAEEVRLGRTSESSGGKPLQFPLYNLIKRRLSERQEQDRIEQERLSNLALLDSSRCEPEARMSERASMSDNNNNAPAEKNFAPLYNWYQRRKQAEEAEQKALSQQQQDDLSQQNKVAKGEQTLKKVLEHARERYISKKLIGTITLSSSLLAVETGIMCTITEADYLSSMALPQESISHLSDGLPHTNTGTDSSETASCEQQISMIENAAIRAMDNLIQSLEVADVMYNERSMTYITSRYAANSEIFKAMTIAPPFPVPLFSLKMQFSATLPSLISCVQTQKEEIAFQLAVCNLDTDLLVRIQSIGYSLRHAQEALLYAEHGEDEPANVGGVAHGLIEELSQEPDQRMLSMDDQSPARLLQQELLQEEIHSHVEISRQSLCRSNRTKEELYARAVRYAGSGVRTCSPAHGK